MTEAIVEDIAEMVVAVRDELNEPIIKWHDPQLYAVINLNSREVLESEVHPSAVHEFSVEAITRAVTSLTELFDYLGVPMVAIELGDKRFQFYREDNILRVYGWLLRHTGDATVLMGEWRYPLH